jgi:hypothetical protein
LNWLLLGDLVLVLVLVIFPNSLITCSTLLNIGDSQMSFKILSVPSGFVALALMVGFLLPVSGVQAAPGTVSACVKKSTGAIRIPSDKKPCNRTETPLEWNIAGPQGLQGVAAQAGTFTFRPLDPIGTSLCLLDGQPGLAMQDNMIGNRCSDLDFNRYTTLGFTSGIEGARNAVMLDLGSEADLAATGCRIFAYSGIHLNATRDRLVTWSSDCQTVAEMTAESNDLFAASTSSSGRAAVEGHVYVVRITDGFDPNFSRIFKFIVTELRDSSSATIRFELL